MIDPIPRIGLYSNQFHSQKRRGVGIYSYQLTHHLLQHLIETRIILIDCLFRPSDRAQMPQFNRPNVEERIIPVPGRLFAAATRYLNWSLLELFTRRKIDLLHSMLEQVPVFHSGPTVMTLHSLAPVLRPELYDKGYRREWISLLDRGLEQADRVICVSATLAGELSQYRPGGSSTYIAVPSGVAPLFLDSSEYENMDSAPAADSKGIDFPYILFVSAADPNKNLERFLQSYSIFVAGNPTDAPYLVLVGERSWGGYEQLNSLIPELGIEDRVHFTGYLEQSQLPAIYRGADLFVLPAFYESFGLPLLEAMASGVPCLVSDIPVFHEIGGENLEYFDPHSAEEMAVRLKQVLNDPDRLQAMAEGGSDRARNYTWRKTARKTLSVYEEVLNTHLT